MKRYRGTHPIFLGLKSARIQNFCCENFNNSEFKFLDQSIPANLNFHIFKFQIALSLYLRSYKGKCFHK